MRSCSVLDVTVEEPSRLFLERGKMPRLQMSAVMLRELVQRRLDFLMVQFVLFQVGLAAEDEPAFVVALGRAQVAAIHPGPPIRVPIARLVLIKPFAYFLFQS